MMNPKQYENFLNNFKMQIKSAYVAVDTAKSAATAPGGDPNMMPPPPPPAPGGDPNMMPPPPGLGGDPNMMPPSSAQQGPNPDDIVNMLDQFSKGMEAVEQKVSVLEQRQQQLESQISETLGRTSTILEILNSGKVSSSTVAQ